MAVPGNLRQGYRNSSMKTSSQIYLGEEKYSSHSKSKHNFGESSGLDSNKMSINTSKARFQVPLVPIY